MDVGFDQPLIKSIGLLAVILIGVLLGAYELARFFLKEAEFRKFWLKVWFVVAATISVFFWLLLIFQF